MSKSTMIAPFAVVQSTTDVDKQIDFYKDIGFVVDDGYEPLESLPDEYFTARSVSRANLKKTVALRLPADPYMHLILFEWTNLKTTAGWPATFNQVGTRGICLLVDDVQAELGRLRLQWPNVRVLQEPFTLRRKWGQTTSALLLDPEQIFLEILSIEKGSPFDPDRVKPPTGTDRCWLHFMHMCVNYHETRSFYESFGMSHDSGVDFRPKTGFHPWGYEYFARQMYDAFGFDMSKRPTNQGPVVAFLRSERDCSYMHIELINSTKDNLQEPGPVPTWTQRGISRYCFKTQDYAGALAKAKAKGTKIFIEDQRGCLNWGNSQWFYFADVDGNIRTLEEWFPHRHWGERE